MYFDLYIDDRKLGTFGHPSVENLNISLSGAPDQNYVFAGAVCREGESQCHYHWLQEEISHASQVRIVPVEGGSVPLPIRRYEMGRAAREASGENVCEFCQRNETEVHRLIPGDSNRPGICSDCVALCSAILRDEA